MRQQWARLLPGLLKPGGYRSCHSGKWHLDGKVLAAEMFDKLRQLQETWQQQTGQLSELARKTPASQRRNKP